MRLVNTFITFNPEKKVEKLENEIYSIEKYCEFMTSLENVKYDTDSLIARKLKCERKIVKIKTSALKNMR